MNELGGHLQKAIEVLTNYKESGDLFYCMECHKTYHEIPKIDCGSNEHPMTVEQCVCGHNSFEPLSSVIEGLEKELAKPF